MKQKLKIKIEHENIFGLVFDGWSDGSSNHYLAVYFQCKAGNYLMGHRKLIDETNQNGINTVDTICSILEFYDKDPRNAASLVSDNTHVNPYIANILRVPLIGCSSHKFNLAVNRELDDNAANNGLIEKIHLLCIELRHNNNAGILRLCTKLRVRIKNATRWSSTYQMLIRYNEIKEHLTLERFPHLVAKFLTPQEEVQLGELLVAMKKFNDITVYLQRADLTVLDARAIFDRIVAEYPAMVHHLGGDATLVRNRPFDKGIVLIMKGDEISMNQYHKDECQRLLKPADDEVVIVQPNVINFAENCVQQHKKSKNDPKSDYVNLDFINPTSNICERLFSQSKLTYSSQRKAMLSSTLENTLFLRSNQELWSGRTVMDCHTKIVNDNNNNDDGIPVQNDNANHDESESDEE